MMSEKIRLVLAKKNKSKAWLAEQLGWSTSNLYNKFKRDNFSEKEQQTLADLHYNKIEISDAIYVINVNGYIGMIFPVFLL